MAFFGLFKKKKATTAKIDEAIDSDEELNPATMKAAETRIRHRRLKLLQERMDYLEAQQREQQMEEQIAKMEEDLFGEEEEEEEESDSIEDKLLAPIIMAFSGAVNKKDTPTGTSSIPSTIHTAPSSSLSDEEIKKIVDGFRETTPAWKQMVFKGMSHDKQKKLAMETFPEYDEETIEKALSVIKNG